MFSVLPETNLPFFSPQEVSLLQALADGCQSKEIAGVVDRSKPTVEAMVRMLYAKLHARSRAHLVAKAIAYGIIDVARYASD